MKFLALIGLFTPAVLGSFFDTDVGQRVVQNLEQFGNDLTDLHGHIKAEVFDSWSKSDLDAWLQSHKLDIEDGLATAKKNKDLLLKDLAAKRDAAAAAAGSAGQDFLAKGKEFYDNVSDGVVELWNDNKLLEYIHERGIKEPAEYTHAQLVQLVKAAKDKVPDMPDGHFGRNWFAGWSREDLTAALKKAGEDIEGNRKELVDRIYKVYTEAFHHGQEAGKKAQAKVEEVHDKVGHDAKNLHDDVQAHLLQWKEATFDKWSLEDLKEYVSEFGDDVASKHHDLVAQAKAHYNYYVDSLRPKGTFGQRKPLRPHATAQITSQVELYWAKLVPYIYPVWYQLKHQGLSLYAFIRSKF